jgi:hypothetical protein
LGKLHIIDFNERTIRGQSEKARQRRFGQCKNIYIFLFGNGKKRRQIRNKKQKRLIDANG